MRISDTRLELPREEPYMEGHNTWIGNHPGSLLAFPVADLAEHLMENLWFFAANGYPITDDINGRNIPGLERFSLPHADDPLPLSFVEQYTITEASAELAIATNNGVLALQAMGLGGWTYDGLDRLSVLGGSGDPRAPGLGFVADTRRPLAIPECHRATRIFRDAQPAACAVDRRRSGEAGGAKV